MQSRALEIQRGPTTAALRSPRGDQAPVLGHRSHRCPKPAREAALPCWRSLTSFAGSQLSPLRLASPDVHAPLPVRANRDQCAAVKRPTVSVLAVSILVVAVIDRPGRGLNTKDMVDYPYGVLDPRIISTTQSQAHEIGEVQAHECRGQDQLSVAVASAERGPSSRGSGVREQYARNIRQRPAASRARCPLRNTRLKAFVPVIRQALRVGTLLRCKPRGRGDQRADRNRERKRVDTGVFFPPVLIA